MSWRDQLRKASFRGVSFLVDSAEGEFGRRSITHEYPLRDKPYVEDLGRKARSITLEAYVLATVATGLDYMPARDALIAALELAGPGVLVHPYLGEMRVSLTASKLRESTKEGGLAHFSLTFVESGEVVFPNAQASTPAIVNARADAAEVSIAADFAKKFSLKSLPEFAANAAKDLLGNASKLLGDVTKLVPADPLALAEYLPNLASLTSSLSSLAQSPLDLAEAVIGQVDRLRALAKNPLEVLGIPDPRTLVRNPMLALKMLRKLFTFGAQGTQYPTSSIPLTTPTRIQQSQNQNAVSQLVQRSAVIAATRSAAETDFTTFDDAAAVRTELVDRLDDLMAQADNDDVYNALASLRSATVKDITARGADRGRLVSYTSAASVPAVALAYDLYDDATRDAEIVLRNRVRHPGFVPGGRAIEVLADV